MKKGMNNIPFSFVQQSYCIYCLIVMLYLNLKNVTVHWHKEYSNGCIKMPLILCILIIEPVHEISNNVVCATSKASDQPGHTCSLIRAFATCLSSL